MSIDQMRRELNRLDNEIIAIERKSNEYARKEAAANGNLLRVKKGIPKNASQSTLRSKELQIYRYNDEAMKAAKVKADTDKKLVDKRRKRADMNARLQKAEADWRKKEDKTQKSIQQKLELRIQELTHQPTIMLVDPIAEGADKGIEEYDVFVCHAWEDKEGFVDELVLELNELNVKVWYDKERIDWGDSIRVKIDEGLAKSKFAVVVISPHFIAKGKFWPKEELDGLFQKESVNGKTVLPIWHNITKKEVMAYSLTLAGKLAMTTATMTPKEIADEFSKLLSNEMPDGTFP
jgi:hypothetical protein